MEQNSITRRDFITKSTLATAGISVGLNTFANSEFKRVNPSDKIRVGFIGVGNRGTQLMNWFRQNQEVEVAALCDVYEPYTIRDRSKVAKRYLDIGKVPKMGENFDNNVKQYTDFRKLLEQKDIDAVCIATPDHWHAIQTVMAMDAGKHVYVEKPLTITVKEGREMVKAQERTGRIAAVGLNRRGSSIYQKLAKEMKDGLIGKVTTAHAQRTSNMYPDGIGRLKPEDPPKDFNWDLWLGPRKHRPYQYNIAPYFFRWWKDYSSQMGNWGVHYMDVIRWMIGETAPSAITASGGKYAVNDDRDIPDTMEVMFEFASGAIVKFSIHEANSGGGVKGGEIALHGVKGNVIASQNGYTVNPAWPGQFQTWKKLADVKKETIKGNAQYGDLATKENSTANLIRDFLKCIKDNKQPLCTLEDGHRSTCFAHLANIALETGMRLEWDAGNERFTNSEKANELLHYDYRSPWKL